MAKSCTAYLAMPMTGWDKQQMLIVSKYCCNVLREHGIIPWSPVLHEEISGKGELANDKNSLDWKWPMDKKALNDCFVFINLRADDKSFGVEREQGRHRYCDWQPVIIISPKHSAGYISIANYEDDLIVADIETAAKEIQKRWGTWHQRVLWKLNILRHFPKWAFRQLRRLFQ